MEWYQWISYIVGLLGVGSVIGFFIKESILRKKEQYERGTKEERKEEILEAVRPLFDKLEHQNNELQKDVKSIQDDVQLLKSSEQASLRHNLLEIYNKWMPMGYCPQDVKDDFENQYQKYHKLGNNGVMDADRQEILGLPTMIVNNTHMTLNEAQERKM